MARNKVRIWVFPTWVMHRWPFYPQAFSSVRFTVLGMTGLLLLSEFFFGMLYMLSNTFPFILMTTIALSILGTFLVFFLVLYFFGILVIGRDCFNCLLGFHVIAHETTHIKLNLRNEEVVEEETLKQTRSQLIPMLAAFPELCKKCAFRGPRYEREIAKYLQNMKKVSSL